MSTYVYCRQSSGSNEQSVSIDQQIENCTKQAEKEKLTVSKVFADYNCSGRLYPIQLESLAAMDLVYQEFLKETKKKGQWRTELGNLLNVLKKNDTIIIDDKTRFCRSLNGSYLENALIQILKGKTIKLLSVKEGQIDFNDFGQQLVFNLQSSINSDQLEKQRIKSKASLKRLKDAGELKQSIGTAIGYKYTGIKKQIAIDPKTAPIIKYVFENYLKGQSLMSMCREIHKTWGRNVVVKSLKNIINRIEYSGYTYDSNGNIIPCKQTAGQELIDFNTWKQTNQLLNSRKGQKFQVKKYPNHFTSMVKCGVCGSIMKVCINNHGKYFSLRCMNHVLRSQNNCKISITANTLYSHGLSLDDAVSPLLIIGLLKKLQANPNQDKNVLSEKQIELQNLLNQEQKLTELFMKGLLDASIYENNLKQLKENKMNVQQEIIQLEQNLKDDDSDRIRSLVNKIVARKLSFEDYQELIAYTIKDIVVFHDKVVVNTVEGPVELERFKERGILKLREYIWGNLPNNYRIFYYKDNYNIYSKTRKVIFKTPYLTVYQLN